MALNIIPVGTRTAGWRRNSGDLLIRVVALAIAPTEDLAAAPRMWAIGPQGQWLACGNRPDEGSVEL